MTAHDSCSVERSVLSDNAQVLCTGQRVVGLEPARRLAREWIGCVFDPTGASAAQVDAITGYERCRPTPHTVTAPVQHCRTGAAAVPARRAGAPGPPR